MQYRDEQAGSGSGAKQDHRSTASGSSQSTAKPASSPSSQNGSKGRRRKHIGSGKIIHAVASNTHVAGKTTPVLLRDHTHAVDPATPQKSQDPKSGSRSRSGSRSESGSARDTKKVGEAAELNLDLQELGLEDSVIRADLLHKLERIGSGGFKE